jgi:hypothetical protein
MGFIIQVLQLARKHQALRTLQVKPLAMGKIVFQCKGDLLQINLQFYLTLLGITKLLTSL